MIDVIYIVSFAYGVIGFMIGGLVIFLTKPEIILDKIISKFRVGELNK